MILARLAPVALALGTVGLFAVPAPAHAATTTRTAQTSYFCDISQDGGTTPIDSDSMTLGMTLDVPTSVTPGQRVALRGTLSLAFPEELSQDAKGFVTTADGYSDSMSLQLGMAGRTQVFAADRWQTPEIPVGDPMVVHAPIAFPAFTVPANAGAQISLTMPTNNVLKNPYFASPATIAFAASAAASGPLGTFHFNLSCYLKSGSPSLIARIPVQAARAGSPAKSGTSKPAPAAASPGSSAPAASPSAAAPAPTTAPTAGAVRTTAAATGATAQPSAVPVQSLVPTAAQEKDGIYVPTGVLVGIGALVCVAAIGYAGWAHYRLRMLQRFLDS